MKLNRREMLRAAGAALFSSGVWLGTKSVWGAADGANAYALHIGVDQFDPQVYPGTAFLAGCVNDASNLYNISKVRDNGFTHSKILKNNEATFSEVARWIHWAAIDLKPGATFLVTYSGHGSQLTSRLEPEESDRSDETWCLYDAQMRDDYRYWLCSHFQAGVKIVMISDSCHSGTAARAITRSLSDLALGDKSKIRGLVSGIPNITADTESRSRASASSRDPGVMGATRVRMLSETQRRAAEEALANKYGYGGTVRSSPHGRFNLRDELGDFGGENAVSATGLLIAACQDTEEAQESRVDPAGGLFTKALVKNVKNKEVGGYMELHGSAVRDLSGIQRPNWFPFGNKVDDSANGINISRFYNETKPFTAT